MWKDVSLKSFLCCYIVIGFILIGNCQEAARPVDNSELKRPEPLFTMESSTGKNLLNQISDTLKHHGFKIVKIDYRDMQLESTKKLSAQREDYDKIIMWIERDYSAPDRFLKVYFEFGRFMDIVSYERKIKRIEISKNEEENLVGELKRSLISINR